MESISVVDGYSKHVDMSETSISKGKILFPNFFSKFAKDCGTFMYVKKLVFYGRISQKN